MFSEDLMRYKETVTQSFSFCSVKPKKVLFELKFPHEAWQDRLKDSESDKYNLFTEKLTEKVRICLKLYTSYNGHYKFIPLVFFQIKFFAKLFFFQIEFFGKNFTGENFIRISSFLSVLISVY